MKKPKRVARKDHGMDNSTISQLEWKGNLEEYLFRGSPGNGAEGGGSNASLGLCFP